MSRRTGVGVEINETALSCAKSRSVLEAGLDAGESQSSRSRRDAGGRKFIGIHSNNAGVGVGFNGVEMSSSLPRIGVFANIFLCINFSSSASIFPSAPRFPFPSRLLVALERGFLVTDSRDARRLHDIGDRSADEIAGRGSGRRLIRDVFDGFGRRGCRAGGRSDRRRGHLQGFRVESLVQVGEIVEAAGVESGEVSLSSSSSRTRGKITTALPLFFFFLSFLECISAGRDLSSNVAIKCSGTLRREGLLRKKWPYVREILQS